MISFKEYISQLNFFIRSFEKYIITLFTLSLIIGIIDAGSVALLYPLISVGFDINSANTPLYNITQYISNLIPLGSPFVHLGLLFIFITGVSLCLQLFYWKIAFIFQRNLIVNIKRSIFSKINSNDYKFFVESRQGDLINLINQSPYLTQQTYDRLICLCTDLVSSLFVIIMLFFISPSGLILVLIGGGLFYILINIISNNISEKIGTLQISSGQSENRVINEYITGIKSIKSLHASKNWEQQYHDSLMIYWEKFADLMFIQRIPIVGINSLFYITIGVIVLILYVYYADNFISIIPILGTFAAAMIKILPKFMNMGTYKMELQNFQPHVTQIFTILHDIRYQTLKNGVINCNEINSDIILENVDFSYGHTKILHNISITIKKGSMTALVGPSGSGKSTIASLLLRLYDPTNGKILINGIDMKEYDINTYHDIVGYVSQDPFIFNASIRDNVLFGGNFSEVELIEASKLAYAHDFIMELPSGYDTKVGDQGITLSGGEKQRIVIARAMIRRPELLILDEATSALDNISEATVQKAIDKVSKECTTLIIAHRLSTIRSADKIVVIEKGRIIEEGTHIQLIEKKGKYWQMSK